MLNKAMVLHDLGQAKMAHKRWVKRIEHLISGLPVDIHSISVEETDCGFGKWLYGIVGEKLRSNYIFEPTINQIELLHHQLHVHYGEIRTLLDAPSSSLSLIQKFVSFGTAKVSKRTEAEAKSHFLLLEGESEKLIHQIEKLEKAVKAVDMVILYRREQASSAHPQF